MRTQHLGNGQHQISSGRTFGKFTGQPETDHPGNQHGYRLTQHGRLCLNATDAPAEYTETIDHRGVGVSANAGVRIGNVAVRHDNSGKGLNIDLVHNAGAWRHHFETVQSGLPPAQELVALAVALVFQVDIAASRIVGAEEIGNHGVIDDQLCG